MEIVAGDIILKDMQEVEADEVFRYKEFLLVFYGAKWSPKSEELAEAIGTVLVELNPENEEVQQNIEAIYISNDRKYDEFSDFMKTCNEEVPWCALPWNDERIYKVK